MLRTVPYVRFLKRFLYGAGSLDSVCDEMEILCAEEVEELDSPFFLPKQLDRLLPFKADRSFRTATEAELEYATRTVAKHAPTIAYRLKDASLFDGSIYVQNYRQPITEVVKNGQPRFMETAQLVSSYLGTRFFGHWLRDDCTTYQLASKPISVAYPNYPDLGFYAEKFCQDWQATDRAQIRNLTIFQDFSQNSHKRRRYAALRKKIARGSGSTLVYLMRGGGGQSRIISNETEIVSELMKHGFIVVEGPNPALSTASIVVSIEGSHTNHCLYAMPKRSALLVLQPPDRFSANSRGWCCCVGIKYGFVIGTISSHGYYFSPSEILRTMDLI